MGENMNNIKLNVINLNDMGKRFSSSKWRERIKSSSFMLISFVSGCLLSVIFFYIITTKTTSKRFIISSASVRNELNLDEFLTLIQHSPKVVTEVQTNDIEALVVLKIALEIKSVNEKKAIKLFKHALKLAPRLPEVLTHYGEFLESRDVVSADQYYYKALIIDPRYNKALENRQRTASFVANIDENRLKRLDEKRDAISAIPDSNTGFKRAKKEAYIQNIYHSVGIEGNTMTLAETRFILETRNSVGGKSVDEHNEILGLDAAMKFVNASLVNRNDYISLKDILEIHKRVLGHVDPIEGGVFRTTQVYVGSHIPPNPKELHVLMNQFEEWLNSHQVLEMHPIRFAALAHYKLVHIHPFVDGNGRTSRLLMNTILMRFGFPPVIIQKQHRLQYYDFLQLANDGDCRPFIRFVADCTEKTLDLFLWATSELSHQKPLLLEQQETYDSNRILTILDDDSSIESSGNYPN